MLGGNERGRNERGGNERDDDDPSLPGGGGDSSRGRLTAGLVAAGSGNYRRNSRMAPGESGVSDRVELGESGGGRRAATDGYDERRRHGRPGRHGGDDARRTNARRDGHGRCRRHGRHGRHDGRSLQHDGRRTRHGHDGKDGKYGEKHVAARRRHTGVPALPGGDAHAWHGVPSWEGDKALELDGRRYGHI